MSKFIRIRLFKLEKSQRLFLVISDFFNKNMTPVNNCHVNIKIKTTITVDELN